MKTALDKLRYVVDALRQAVDENVSGGHTTFEDLAYLLEIKPDDGVLWHHSKWLKTNHADEEMEIVVFGRVRKVKSL